MKYKNLLNVFIAIIIIWGIAIRLFLFLHNRDLIIDEANIARNLFERDFGQLALPLSYEQYAPPVFLWIEKIFTLIFGFSEYSLRLYSLLAGIASLFLIAAVMKEITSFRSAWYPLFLMAISFTFIFYSSEVKQYMPDVMITLGMIYVALRTDISTTATGRFFALWFVTGSVAIWASMPAVFVLTGIGIYYLYQVIRNKDHKKTGVVIALGTAWILQFIVYYLAILRPQANSEYLQKYHHDYFLFLLPKSTNELKHNWYLFRELLQQASGYEYWSWKFNCVLMIIGSVLLLRNNTAKGMLITVPVIAALFAAALHQFSLIPRVALFIMPLMLLLIGYGFERLLRVRFIPLQLGIVLIALLAVKHFNITSAMIKEPTQDERIKEELAFMAAHHMRGNDLYIGNGSAPAYIYYTQINPAKNKWPQLAGARFLCWDTNYDTLLQHSPDTCAFLYTTVGKDELQQYKVSLQKYMHCTDSIEIYQPRCFAFIYLKAR